MEGIPILEDQMSWSGEKTPSQESPREDAEEHNGIETVVVEPQPQEQDIEPVARPSGSKMRPLLVEILQTVLLTLIIFAGVRSVVQNFKVDGASMEPTLHSGQYLLITKMAYFRLEGVPLQVAERIGAVPADRESYFPFGGPQHGDIIVFRFPGTPDRDFIKRVIGLPGDTIQIDHGKVYRNGVQLDEEYIRAVPSYSLPAQKVPEGNYFVLGDNRPNSSDSHIWGFVPEANAIGKAWVSYWPPNQWGVLGNVGLAGGSN
jgi:signal peptidase I